MEQLPTLYLQEDKADSHPVAAFLVNQGISYRDRSHASPAEMSDETGIQESEISEKLPLLRWSDGSQLENCDTNRLVAFLHDRGYEFEDS